MGTWSLLHTGLTLLSPLTSGWPNVRTERSFRSEIFCFCPVEELMSFTGHQGRLLHLRPALRPLGVLGGRTGIILRVRGILKALEVPGYGQRLWPGCPYGGKRQVGWPPLRGQRSTC